MIDKIKIAADNLRIKLFGPESHKVHLLDFEIFTAWIAIGLVIFGTFVGIYRAQHWQWGVLNHIPVISTIFNGGHHGTNTNGGSGSGSSSGGGGSSSAGGGSSSGGSSGSGPGSVKKITGWLHTSGTHLLNDQNQPVQLFGFNWQGLDQKPGYPHVLPTQTDYDNIKNWGFNSLRLPLSWGQANPATPTVNGSEVTYHWDQSYFDKVDTVVNELSKRGVSVILDFHPNANNVPTWAMQGQSSTSFDPSIWQCSLAKNDPLSGLSSVHIQTAWFAYVRTMESRYHLNSMVIGSDMLNEPSFSPHQCGTNLDGFYKRSGDTVHAVAPNQLVILEETTSAYEDNGLYAMSRKPSLSNIVVSFHSYKQPWSAAETNIEAYLNHIDGWNVPVWVGEHNAFGTDSPKEPLDPNWQADTASMFGFFKAHNIGWAYWDYQGALGLTKKHSDLNQIITVLQGGFYAAY